MSQYAPTNAALTMSTVEEMMSFRARIFRA